VPLEPSASGILPQCNKTSPRKVDGMELSEDDVLHILKLIDESKFDYFQLEVGELKITVSKGEPIPLNSSPQQIATAPAATPAPMSAKPAAAPSAAAAPAVEIAPASVEARAAAEGLLTVTAPLLGTFYVAPEPGAPPFTHVGANVTEDTTVALIEVMKVFNSVRAGVKGTIVEAVAQNGQFVEYGQTLFLVKP
jgi:acetyl-CoA carboxylase biotin carboxyl carrier protein